MSTNIPDPDQTDQAETDQAETDPPKTVDQLSLRLLVLSELAKRVGRARDEIKAQLQQQLTAGDAKKPHLPGQPRRPIGSVSYTKGKMVAKVSDLKALTSWSMKHYPESVDLVPQVKEWHVKAMLEASAAAEQPAHPDGTLDVEGITVAISDPFISARPGNNIQDDEWRVLMRNYTGLDELTE